jgi:hypothetical protein
VTPASPPLPPFFASLRTDFRKKNASRNSEARNLQRRRAEKGGEPGEGGGTRSPALQNYLLNKLPILGVTKWLKK